MTVEADRITMSVEADRAWMTGGRRGKRARRFIGESHEENLAGALVMLARSGGGNYPFPAAAAAEAIVDDNNDKKKTHQETSSHDDNKKREAHAETSRDHDNNSKKTHEETSHDHDDKKKKKTHEETSNDHDDKKKKKAYHQETAPHQNNSHRCSICNKEFSSYQALGGHKTSHREKNPSTNAAAMAIAKPSAATPANTNALHECTTCNRRFPTGQALGGHKRKHYEGVIGRGKSGATTSSASAITIAAASDNCGATSTHDHHIHGEEHQTLPFDLNVLASPEAVIDLSLRL